MGKIASYVLLALVAIVGLGSVYQMNTAADVIAQANADVAKAKADQATRSSSSSYESSSSPIDPSYGESSDAEGADPEPEIPSESGAE